MKKMLVYSHDTYGLGNITRMLAICRHLIEAIPNLSVLLVTGSPVVHSLRLPESLDYIKLPCLTRTGRGEYTTKYLSARIEDAIQLRSDLILATVANFKPDLLMVDKKPVGIKGELAATLEYLQAKHPETRQVLILRDILDSAEAVIGNWERNGHYDAIKKYYDLVLVVGEQEIFDPRNEYQFPPSVIDQTFFCGYLRKEAEPNSREATRRLLSIGDEEKLVLVTPGGGQDGFQVIETYLAGLSSLRHAIKSLVVCGPEMPDLQQAKLHHMALNDRSVIFYEFTGEMVSLMAASDVVIAMGGYNTICEILSLEKCAIVVPRVRPTEEQWIRARQMSHRGLFKAIHPDELTPERLMRTLREYLESDCRPTSSRPVNLNALPVVADRVNALLNHHGEARA